LPDSTGERPFRSLGHDPQRLIRAVLFDLDGTLLDTAPDLCGALNELRLERGLEPMPFEALRPYSSKGARGLIGRGFAHTEGEDRAVCTARFLALYANRLARETRYFEEVPQLLDEIERTGIRWGIVTNKATYLTEPLLKAMDLATRPHVVVCGDTLHERKPSPLPLLHAAEKLDVSPAECLYVGDAESDMRAADAAGMLPLAVRFGYIAEEDKPHEWPAHAWLDSPLQLLDWLKR
jgi:phosphoglycolate phosphatase